MSSKPLVSVIMNCHNGEKYLKQSVKSVLKQNYNKWELIFWNNNSNDNSKKIIQNFRDKRIRYFESKKLIPLYKARNLAIKKARGEFICFLDTDDWWIKTKLIKQLNIFKKNKKCQFLFSNYFKYNHKFKKKKLAFSNSLPSGNITQKLLLDYSINILTVMMKRSIFKKSKFNNKYNIIGDFDFFINKSLRMEFYSIQKPLAYYRLHSKNFSEVKLSLYNEELDQWFKLNEKKFKKLNYSLLSMKILYLKNVIKRILNFLNIY